MQKNREIRVTFFPIKTAREKKEILVTKAAEYFENHIPLLFCLPSEEAMHYLDSLLWSYPKESFLPHEIASSSSSQELLVLTTQKEISPNNARSLFYLRQDSAPNTPHLFSQVYQFENLSSSEKTKDSPYQVYKERGWSITIQPPL